MKLKYKITTVLLLAATLPGIPAYATSKKSIEAEIFENKEAIEDKYAEKSKIQNEIKKISSEMQSITVELSGVLSDMQRAEGRIGELDDMIETQEVKVLNAEKKVTSTEHEIVEKIEEIKSQEEELALMQSLLDERVRETYKQNTKNGIINLLLESEGFIDFFERLRFIERMTIKDNETITAINELIVSLEEKKQGLENTRTMLIDEKISLENEKGRLLDSRHELQTEKATLTQKQKNIETLEREKAEAIKAMSSEEIKIAQEIGDIMDENEKLESSLQALIREEQRRIEEQRKAEEAKRQEQNNGQTSPPQVSNQGYVRPTSGRVSSPYGYRIHPIWNVKRMHTGVDYAAPTGTPIVATKSGTVISSRYMNSYGNTVIVDHGNGVSSLYAHMSSFSVSAGDRVSQGQKLGGVGSTGNSTGPHLHFEIRVNGAHVNPSNYTN